MSNNVTNQNPAGRLHQIISKAKLQSDPISPAILWARVFDVSVKDEIKQPQLLEVVDRLNEFRGLVEEAVKLAVLRHPSSYQKGSVISS